jgi:NAD(P)-dependent dehydrogenase (short-subunit alcohol dehydrogenase family)
MNNPLDFSGKVALITGAAAGMGLATAHAFAEAGAAVVLADFKEEAVKAAAQKLFACGHKALAVRCDVSDDGQVAAMVDRTVAELGRLDAAFNNAGSPLSIPRCLRRCKANLPPRRSAPRSEPGQDHSLPSRRSL